MKLSILIPTVPSRKFILPKLLEKLEKQATDLVQIVSLYDNKRWSVGLKRNHLLKLALGQYITYIDDDDDISDDYIESILQAMETSPDLITFDVRYTSDKGDDYICEYGAGQRPAHVHVWKYQSFTKFPERDVGEDIRWVKDNLNKVTSTVHIDKVLYHYKFNSLTTETQ